MFVRIKKIKGKEYGYLVTNEWTKKGPRQKTQGYLGRVFLVGKVDESTVKLPPTEGVEFSDIVDYLVRQNLKSVGFIEKDGKLVKDDLEFSEGVASYRGRKACLKVNEGIMCSHTIDTLRRFERSGDDRRDIVLFAEAVVNTGIKLTKDVFVTLFTLLPKPEMEIQDFREFEY